MSQVLCQSVHLLHVPDPWSRTHCFIFACFGRTLLAEPRLALNEPVIVNFALINPPESGYNKLYFFADNV